MITDGATGLVRAVEQVTISLKEMRSDASASFYVLTLPFRSLLSPSLHFSSLPFPALPFPSLPPFVLFSLSAIR